MNAWLSDAPAVPNSDHGAFNPSVDPSMPYMQQGNPNAFNPNQLQNPQFQQRMLNGATRNGSPAFHNPSYAVNPVIPSKRPREDSFGASPRQAPGGLPTSRSLTPSQTPYPGYHAAPNGAPHMSQTPTPYQHLQGGGSTNATPSPRMPNQQFNPQVANARVGTASPSPFSPNGPHMGGQMSPQQSEHGSRVNTPQNGVAGFGSGMPYGQAYNPQYSASPGMQQTGPQNPMAAYQNSLQNMDAQRKYQMQVQYQSQQQQLQKQAAAQAAAQGRPPPNAMIPGQQMTPQMMAARQQAQQAQRTAMMAPRNPEQFIQGLQNFMASRNMPLDPNPMIAGRPISLPQLYGIVMRQGGSKRVTAVDQWHNIAEALHISPMQFPTAVQELQALWHRNLAPYESVLQASQQKRALELQQRGLQQGQPNYMPNHGSPVKSNFQAPDPQAQQLAQLQQQNAQQKQVNGYSTPQPNIPPNNYQRSSLSRQPDSSPGQPPPSQFPVPSPGSARKKSIALPKMNQATEQETITKEPIQDPYKPISEASSKPTGLLYGPVDVDEILSVTEELVRYQPVVPNLIELGPIDIHALTMSIQSGIHAEVRYALDTLSLLSAADRLNLSLDSCEDLLDILIECAEEQLDVLAENTAEVFDDLLISPYEDVLRACKVDGDAIEEDAPFGSLEYALDRAVERLICITTILRNLAFNEKNHDILAQPVAVKFFSTVMQYLGTRNMLLRTNRNTLDFMKDAVVYLGELAQKIKLPGREEGLSILHFLLAFAPCPQPLKSGSDEIMFSPYDPKVHRYLPSAIDGLAKLLAVDDPNRMYYRSIFAADGASNGTYELLTRTFGLAISPVPSPPPGHFLQLIHSRLDILLQGMLAADILSTFCPNSEHPLARSWLDSRDGFAESLLRLVCVLSIHSTNPRENQMINNGDPNFFAWVTHRGMAVLKRLAEKSRNPEHPNGALPSGVMVKKENLLGAMLTAEIDPKILRELCTFAGWDS